MREQFGRQDSNLYQTDSKSAALSKLNYSRSLLWGRPESNGDSSVFSRMRLPMRHGPMSPLFVGKRGSPERDDANLGRVFRWWWRPDAGGENRTRVISDWKSDAIPLGDTRLCGQRPLYSEIAPHIPYDHHDRHAHEQEYGCKRKEEPHGNRHR